MHVRYVYEGHPEIIQDVATSFGAVSIHGSSISRIADFIPWIIQRETLVTTKKCPAGFLLRVLSKCDRFQPLAALFLKQLYP